MKIIKLAVQNIMRLNAVEIEPSGNLIVIGGRNAQGKTATLDAIAMALGGRKLVPAEPIKEGADRAKVEVTLDNFIVTRTFKRDKHGEAVSTIQVTARDGKQKYARPQEMLDQFYGRLAFDPLEFLRMAPKDQLVTLKELVGLDFAGLNERRQAIYDKRHDVNSEVRRRQTMLEETPYCVDVEGQEPISTERLTEELQEIIAHNQKVTEQRNALQHERDQQQRRSQRIIFLEQEIERFNAELNQIKAERNDASEVIGTIQRGLEGNPERDLAEIKTKLDRAEQINRALAQNAKRAEIAMKLSEVQGTADDHTTELEKIDREKRAMIAQAKMPIKTLCMGDEGVLLNGLPFEQASSAEQLRVSVAMGMALNPELNVLLIRDGSLLDEDNLKLIAQMAEQKECQVWLERVGDGEEVSFVIEDGRVKEK